MDEPKDLSGILLVDKPPGMTSHDVIDAVRAITQTREIGHTGSLDPDATGLLLLCLGKALKVVQFLDGLPKAYDALFRFGVSTNTDDAMGEVIEEHPVPPTEIETLRKLCGEFTGEILQRPPIFSAVKVDGKRSYRLARKGIHADLPRRTVCVSRLDLLSWEPPLMSVHMECSKGTYVRSIARDLGERLGCGGIVERLRRTSIGTFGIDRAVALEGLDVARVGQSLLPVEEALEFLEKVEVGEENARKFRHGLMLILPRPFTGLIRVFCENRFIGVGAGEGNIVRPKRIFPD